MGRRNPLTDWAHFFLVGGIHDVISHARFGDDHLRGSWVVWGSKFSIFCWSSLQLSHYRVSVILLDSGMLFMLFVWVKNAGNGYNISFSTKFADLFVLLTYDHNIMLISKTESIATSIGIDYWEYLLLQVLILVLAILLASIANNPARVCSTSRSGSKFTWYGHFCTGTKIASWGLLGYVELFIIRVKFAIYYFLHFNKVHQVAARLRAKSAIYDCLVNNVDKPRYKLVFDIRLST